MQMSKVRELNIATDRLEDLCHAPIGREKCDVATETFHKAEVAIEARLQSLRELADMWADYEHKLEALRAWKDEASDSMSSMGRPEQSVEQQMADLDVSSLFTSFRWLCARLQ